MLGYRILWGQQIPFPKDSFVELNFEWVTNISPLETSVLGHGSCLHYV